MPTPITDFDYTLPKGQIAQAPANPRETAKLMVLHRKARSVEHCHVSDLPKFFQSGDIIVINNTKVFHARLHGTIPSGSRVELFLIRPRQSGWLALVKPGKKIRSGETITISSDFCATVLEKHDDGTLTVDFSMPQNQVIEFANHYGEIPIPPYIKKMPSDDEYQTVYAKHIGSVAAPTAGFHLTESILSTLRQRGVTILEITLHVGLGTFMPVKTETLESHTMHSEWVHITKHTASAITEAKQSGRRIVVVGTTTVRTLEGVAALNAGTLKEYSGDINIFITPGFTFRITDVLLTNFHLPKSTLLVLISAFADREIILDSYKLAVEQNYRFFSFGDAMLILP